MNARQEYYSGNSLIRQNRRHFRCATCSAASFKTVFFINLKCAEENETGDKPRMFHSHDGYGRPLSEMKRGFPELADCEENGMVMMEEGLPE